MVRHTQASAIFSIARQKRNANRRSGRQRALTATALSGGMLAALLIATPALAQQGGAGGYGNFGSGGNGGNAGQPGDPASCGALVGAPIPECTHPGGAAGTPPGGSGSPSAAANFNPTGGGGGGADGDAGAPIGGDGGDGGNSLDTGNYTSGGGGGGAGGNGLILGTPFVNSGMVRGGRGGNGGFASPGRFDAAVGGGGGGGEGGTGIIAFAGGTIVNEATGSITGGNGGTGGAGDGNGGPAGANGAGGEGIRGAGVVIDNAGSISGGLGGDGVTRAYALHFTGNGSILILRAGGSITGDIQIDTGAQLAFNVSGTETLDNVISGDGSIFKTGGGTLILSGINTYTGSTTLTDGTLQIGDAANIGGNTIAFNGGTLRTTFDGTLGNALDWGNSGYGTIAAAAGSTLTLTGAINATGSATVAFGNATDTGTVILANAQGYTAGTVVNGGTLQLDDLTSFASASIALNAGTLRTTVDGTIGGNLAWGGGATGAIAAATGTTLTLTGQVDFSGITAQFGTATDTGTIVADFNGGLSSGGPRRLRVGGGTLLAGSGGTLSLLLGSIEHVQIDTGATLDLHASQPSTTLNALEGAGTLLDDGATTIVHSGAFAGTVTGTQNLIKIGGTTLILSGDNDYSGTTQIDGGTLQIGNGGTSGTLGTGSVTVASGATLAYARSDNYTESHLIDGAGSVQQVGPGVLTLSAANTYSGGTLITGGLINFTDNDNLGVGSIVMDGGGLQWATGNTIDISSRVSGIGPGGAFFDTNGNDVTLASTLSGSGGLTKLGSGVLTLSGNNSFGGPVTVNDGTLYQDSSGALGGASIVLGGASATLDIGNYNLLLSQAASITGTGTLLSSGTGVLTTASGEDMVFGSLGGSIVTSFGIAIDGGSTLTMYGNNVLSGGITVDGKLVIGETGAAGDAGNTITTTGSVISYADQVDNAATVVISSTTTQLEVLNIDVATQSGVIDQDVAGRGFEKIGGGTLNLTGANLYTGTTVVTGGTLGFNEQAIGTSAAITIDNGAAIRLLGDVDYNGALNILSNGGTVDTDSYSFSIADTVTLQGELTKTGSGTLLLKDQNGDSTGAGGINVLAGTLALGSDTAAGTGTIKLADATTLLNASCGCNPLTVNNAIEIAIGGTATIDADGYETILGGSLTGGNLLFTDTYGGGSVRLTGTNSYGDTTVSDSATLIVGDGGTNGTLGTGTITSNGMLAFDHTDTVTLATAVGGTGMLGQFGEGTLILTADNTYSGGTLLLNPDGTIRVGNGGTVGSLGTGDIVLGGGTLIFDRSDDVTIADSIAGTGLITKLGAGTLTLSGDNLNGSYGPYLGDIAVQAGTLAVGQFGLGGSQLVTLSGGTTLTALDDAYAGDITILTGGATIDTGSHIFEMIGALDLQGELTKVGSGTLLLDDLNEEGIGDGGINVTAGTLGLGSDYAGGTGIIKLADGTTLLNAACGCSSLDISNDIQVALGGTVTFDGAGNTTDLNGAISGGNIHFATSYSAPFAGTIFRLSGANSYGESLIGPNVALIVYDGTLGTGDVTFDAAPSDPTTPAALVFENATDYSYGGRIIGSGIVSVETDGGASVTLTGSNSSTANFTGTVDVVSGRLVLNGDFGDVVGNTASMTLSGGALGGGGTFHGSIDLDNAALSPGNSPGTLTVASNLNLGSGAILNYELGAPGTIGGASNDLVNVGGDLTLDGTLNTIASGAGYGPGYYRLFNYGGSLTDNGVTSGAIAGGLDATVLTNINGQVNLLLSGGQVTQYWDGSDTTGSSVTTGGNGGAGTWSATSSNWTDATGYTINDAWQSQVGVFAGAAGGTVTVDGNQAFQELRFETDGYVLRPSIGGAALQTTGGFSIIDVTSGITADIGVVIQGGAGLDKTGTGTLILSAVNTYSGATDIAAGTLRLGINNAIGNQSALNVQAGATLDLAGFTTQAGSLAGAGDITLNNGRLEVGYNNGSTLFSGTITGPDGGTSDFTKNGSGTLTVSGTIDVGRNTALEAIIQVNGGALLVTGTGSLSADMIQNFSTLENSGTINAGVILQSFASLTNNSTGIITGTTQNFASFDNYGTMGALQSLGGTAVNHSTGVINGAVQTFASFTSTGIINGSLSNFATAEIENQVNGELANQQNGAILTLTGTTTGITSFTSTQGAMFDLAGFNTTVGALNGSGGDIELDGATLTIDQSLIALADYSGSLTGPGVLVKTGSGEQILRGVSTNAPIVHVDGGILTLADIGLMNTDVTVASGATFNNNGAIGGYITNNGNLNLGGASSVNSVLSVALINNSGGITHAGGTFNAGVQNAGTFSVVNTLTGVTQFDQSASGHLTLSTNFGVGELTGSGAIDTGNYILSVGSAGTSSSFDGVISGHGGLTKTGGGTFTLTGNNDYTGDTLVSGGTLVVSGTGAITGGVINNATFQSEGVVRGPLYNGTGATALLQGFLNQIENHGTVTLTGTTFVDYTFEQASNAMLDLAGFNATFGALDGAGKIDLGAGTLTLGTNSTDTVFSGTINGSGGLTKEGMGTLTLTGLSTYGGATQINDGTLQLGDGGEIGGGIVYNDATLAFDGALDRSFGNLIQGNGGLIKTGTGLLTLTGINTGFSGAISVEGGTLGFDDGRSLGSGGIALADGTRLRNVEGVTGLIVANAIEVASGGMATLQGIDGSTTTFNGAISGGTVRFGLSGGGATSFTLGVANSYGDTRIGGGVALRLDGAGSLGTGNTLFEASGVPSSLTFANGSNYSYGGTISGSDSILVDTSASVVSVTLSGSNTAANNFTGQVTVDTGRLVLGGDFGDVVNNSASLVLNGGSLGGSGTFHGDVTFGAATLSPGNSPGTLTIAGSLNLGAATILNYELGEAGTVGGANNDLVNVGGNLTLDGTLNVLAQPGFGEGYYRLFNYGGSLTDNGLALGSLPAGYTPTLLTNIAGQVNILFASSPQAIQYWDGSDMTGASTATGGDGGAGIWSGTGTNWTAPTGYGVNDSWRSQVAVFGGASGGTVTVQGTQVFQELRFTTDGYTIAGATAGDGLSTTGGFSVVDVSTGLGATINAVISGSGGLTKTGDGTLNLGGANSYTGVTTVSGGTLNLLAGGALAGTVVNDATFNNAGTIAGLVTNNAVMTSTGTLNGGLDNSGTASIRGALNGAVSNTGNGAITLSGTTTGITTLSQGNSAGFNLNGFDTGIGGLAGQGTVTLGGATLTLGGDNSSSSFGGTITGTGNLIKSGTGTLTLTWSSDFTGTTTVNAGTFQLSTTGELASAVRNNATFNNDGWVSGLVTNTGTLASSGTLTGGLNNSGTASIAGTLSGAVTNSGAITLAGTTTGIGAVTQMAGGSFSLGGFSTSFGSLAGVGTVNINGALFSVGGDNSSTSFGGVISGAGDFTKMGSGTLTLTGANTYTGLTTVSGGTLAVSATGSLAGNVRNLATFTNAGTVTGAVNNMGTLTSTGTLAGGLVNNGSATLSGTIGTALANYGTATFNGAATVAVLQQDAAGTTNVTSTGVSIAAITGSGAITLGSGGALSIGSGSVNSTYGGTISGSGSLTKTGSRTLVLTGAATHTGGTTISGGTLQIGNGGTTGSLSGAIVNNGVLVLNRSDAVTLANAMSGTGAFYQMGTGTTTLTGANSYTGDTFVSAGRLRGDTASLQGIIEVYGALEFAQTSNGTYAGSLYGNGLLDKTGIGTLNLTGTSFFNGATHVIGGGLALNGLLSRSIVTVSNGATLSGTGTAGGVILQSGATIAPGNSVGTFNVAGNVLFQAGSLYAAEVQGSSADRIQATGTAGLNGTLQVIALGGNYGFNTTYVLLHADGGVSGTFAATTGLSAFGLAYRPKIIYTANEVQLLLAPNLLSAVLGTGTPLTYNQLSAMTRIDTAVLAGGYDPTPLSALYSLAPSAIPAALDQLSGEVYADATRAALEDERVVREAVTGRLAEAADTGLTGNGSWGQAIGSWGSVDSDGNAAGYDVNRTGFLMGIDAGGASDDGSWRAGVMGQYTHITVPASARGSRATIDRTGGGFYAGAAIGGLGIRTGATLSVLDLKVRRQVSVPGLSASERGKSLGVMLQTFAELSYRFDAGEKAFVEPYLTGSVSRVSFGRFAESSGPVSLMVHAQKSVLGIAELGLRGETALIGGGDKGAIRLGGNIGLRSAFGDRTANPVIALTAAPNQALNVHAAAIDRFAAAANLNLTADLSDTLSLRVGYSGVLSGSAREHGARATLSLKF